MRVHGFSFSVANSKMGRVGSFSVLPVVTCNCDAPCTKGNTCYAKRMVARYKNVREAYQYNTEALLRDNRYNDLIKSADDFIAYNEFRLFRWNVSGDFATLDYLMAACEVAKHNPDVKFLAFTKQFKVVNEGFKMGIIPSNFNIVFSAWGEFMPDDVKSVPVAYFDHGSTPELIPDYAELCGGDCQHCKRCFNLKPGEAVKFKKR